MVVRVTFLAAGDVATFNAQSFSSALHHLFRAWAESVGLTISAASLNIEARILMSTWATTADANKVVSYLSTTSLADLSASLGVTLFGVGTPTIDPSWSVSAPFS